MDKTDASMAATLWELISLQVSKNCQGCNAIGYTDFSHHDCQLINQYMYLLHTDKLRQHFDIWYEIAMLMIPSGLHRPVTRFLIMATIEALFTHIVVLLPDAPYTVALPPHLR